MTGGARLFDRFSDGAKRVLVLAQEEARGLNHNYLGTEHLLLGLIEEGEGIAAKALALFEVSLEAAKRQVVLPGSWLTWERTWKSLNWQLQIWSRTSQCG